MIAVLAAFLGLAGYFSYQTALSFLSWKHSYDIQTRYIEAAQDLDPATIDELLGEISDESAAGVREELAGIYVDLRIRRAWCYPDTGTDDLRRALIAADAYYGRGQDIDRYLSQEITFAIATAHLPARLERWQAEALAVDPNSRAFTRYMQIWGRLVSDDESGARELLASELATRGNTPDTTALAFVSSVLLGDDEAAGDYEANVQRTGISEMFFNYFYAWYLDEHGRFAESIETRQKLIKIPPTGPEDALWLALPLAGLHGLDDPQTTAMLDLAPQTTRQHLSRAAAEAGIVADLLRITGQTRYAERLLELRAANPADGALALSLAGAAIDYQAEHPPQVEVAGTPAAADPVADSAPPTTLFPAPLLQYVSDSLALADSPALLQRNNVVKALALLIPDGDYVPDDDARDESLRCLSIALGDPEQPGAVISQRIPDYEFFLLDENVKAARAADPDFDSGVHRAIIDYLNRRQALFADIYSLEQIPYRWDRTAPAAEEQPDPPAKPENWQINFS